MFLSSNLLKLLSCCKFVDVFTSPICTVITYAKDEFLFFISSVYDFTFFCSLFFWVESTVEHWANVVTGSSPYAPVFRERPLVSQQHVSRLVQAFETHHGHARQHPSTPTLLRLFKFSSEIEYYPLTYVSIKLYLEFFIFNLWLWLF